MLRTLTGRVQSRRVVPLSSADGEPATGWAYIKPAASRVVDGVLAGHQVYSVPFDVQGVFRVRIEPGAYTIRIPNVGEFPFMMPDRDATLAGIVDVPPVADGDVTVDWEDIMQAYRSIP